ncbi:spermidine synthase [Drosophila pseudoobscura]|uniref:Spermidine synthase n=1 Tax=Drosophila pseudoobscura pseudoobscura TaxID=46245 RepID=A0A6I8UQ55_DROPS|nr:spermidine synthase [Drosophila pseudoobscura]
MDTISCGWFSEIQAELWPGQAFSLKVKNVIHKEKSKYQDIQIIETETYGKCLILDGIIQCTSRDEFSYQEMIAFLPLFSHPNPKKVLIVGGGDGGVAREVVKHPLVEEVHQIEIDERVVELSKQHLPEMACGFKSEKLKLTIGDGFEYMKKHKNEFDVIITDSSDPIGPAVSLFNESYYKLMKHALKEDGIVCSQGGSFWLDLSYIKKTMSGCKEHFPKVSYAITSVPSYPCGHIGFVIGSLNQNQKFINSVNKIKNFDIEALNLKYYTPEVHDAAFALPRWVQKSLMSDII